MSEIENSNAGLSPQCRAFIALYLVKLSSKMQLITLFSSVRLYFIR